MSSERGRRSGVTMWQVQTIQYPRLQGNLTSNLTWVTYSIDHVSNLHPWPALSSPMCWEWHSESCAWTQDGSPSSALYTARLAFINQPHWTSLIVQSTRVPAPLVERPFVVLYALVKLAKDYVQSNHRGFVQLMYSSCQPGKTARRGV